MRRRSCRNVHCAGGFTRSSGGKFGFSASKNARTALSISYGRDVEGFAAVALALAGESGQAERLINSLAKRFPQDTIVQFNYLPCIRAATRIQESAGADAVEHLTAAAPYELGGNFENLNFLRYPVYLRGEAYLAQKQANAAVTEFQKILDYPRAHTESIGAIARLQIARAYAQSGVLSTPKGAYETFLALWKDADSGIRILKAAKAEYERLR
jgi:eukaryotic-like serine/threonine-protein kinase